MNNRILQVLSNRSFLYLWLAEIFSQVAMNMLNFVLIIVAFEIAHSNTAVSGIVLSYTIPSIFFGLVAGVYVDRWNKKSVLIYSNLIRAVLLVGLSFLFNNLGLIYVFSFLINIATQFFIPAETPMIPLLVKKKQLLTANALFGMGVYGSALVGYALSGPLIIIFGAYEVFLILCFLFLAASVLCWRITVKTQTVDEIGNGTKIAVGVGKEIKDILSIIRKTRKIYSSLFLLTMSQIIILILAVLGPGFAREILQVDVNQFPLLFATPAALGMVVGSLVVANYLHKTPYNKIINWGICMSAITVFLLPYGSIVTSRPFVVWLNTYLPSLIDISISHIMVVIAFLLGLSNSFIFVPSNTILQEATTDELRGKIYGAYSALIGVSAVFPIVIVGELADLIGVGRVLTGIACVIGFFLVFRLIPGKKK